MPVSVYKHDQRRAQEAVVTAAMVRTENKERGRRLWKE